MTLLIQIAPLIWRVSVWSVSTWLYDCCSDFYFSIILNKPKLNFWGVFSLYPMLSHNTNLVESPTLHTKDGGNDSCRKEVWSDDKVRCLLLWIPILALFNSNFNVVLKAVPTIPTIPFHNSSLYYNYSS